MQVTPTRTSYLLLKEMEALTGKAPATITRELLDEAAPAMRELIEALRALEKRPQHALAAMKRMAYGQIEGITQATLDLDRAMNAKPGRKPREGATVARAASPKRRQGQGAAKTG
jgi:hypothetical protein